MISLFIIHFPNLGHFLEFPTLSKALCTFQLHVENDDLPGFRFRRLGPCWVNKNQENKLWNEILTQCFLDFYFRPNNAL